MSSTLVTFLSLASLLFAAAAVITVRAVRSAPEGHEDDQGFQLSRVQVAVENHQAASSASRLVLACSER